MSTPQSADYTSASPPPVNPLVIPQPHGFGYWSKIAIRWLALAAGIVVAGWLAYELGSLVQQVRHLRSDKIALKPIPYNDGTKAAISQRVDSVKLTSQAGILILAALWGLFLSKKRDERHLSLDEIDDLPENILLWIATFAMAGVWYAATEYTDAMTVLQTKVARVPADPDQLPDGGKAEAKEENWIIPDFTDRLIDRLIRSQTLLFVTGTILTGWVLYSSHLLKENNK